MVQNIEHASLPALARQITVQIKSHLGPACSLRGFARGMSNSLVLESAYVPESDRETLARAIGDALDALTAGGGGDAIDDDDDDDPLDDDYGD